MLGGIKLEKILAKIKELKDKFEKLKTKSYQIGKEEYESTVQFLERAIDRIYPEKDAKDLKKKLSYGMEFIYESDQAKYLENVNRAIRVIDTILEEAETFGFDDFKPIKEKEETEIGINKGKFSLFKHKTKEK